MKAKFTNKDGTLTAYALHCGYVDVLWDSRLSHDVIYHVHWDGEESKEWASFTTLKEARKFWKATYKPTKVVRLATTYGKYDDEEND